MSRCHKRCDEEKHISAKEICAKEISAKFIHAKEISAKNVQACQLDAKDGNIVNLNSENIVTQNLTVNDVNMESFISNGNKTKSESSKFDCSEENPNYPNFETHCPVQPPYIADNLWKALLDNLSDYQDQLTNNFINGRATLGLPQCEKKGQTFVDLVGTKTFSLVTEDPDTNTTSTRTSMGWDLHVTNQFYREFRNPDTATFNAKVITAGTSGIEGVLEVTSVVKNEIEEGSVLEGPGIPWGTTIYEQIAGVPGGVGTYQLFITEPVAVGPEVQMQSSKFGPKLVSIFIQMGTMPQGKTDPADADIRIIDRGNRQFEPTIDYSGDDPEGTTHTGEQWVGSVSLPNKIINELLVDNKDVIPVVQMAIFAERSVDVYYAQPDCPGLLAREEDDTEVADDTTESTVSSTVKVGIANIASAVAVSINPAATVIRYTVTTPIKVLGIDGGQLTVDWFSVININGCSDTRFNVANVRGSLNFIPNTLVYNSGGVEGFTNVIVVGPFSSATIPPGTTSSGGQIFNAK